MRNGYRKALGRYPAHEVEGAIDELFCLHPGHNFRPTAADIHVLVKPTVGDTSTPDDEYRARVLQAYEDQRKEAKKGRRDLSNMVARVRTTDEEKAAVKARFRKYIDE